ncbi:MAG: M4 family metallopeptidase, partial [Spirosomaceae bacterium]|nr:M4 family metallopeptidase [Spirosomataceae bacterium]
RLCGCGSLNGNGGNIVSVINISDEDGTGLDNAYWNGEFMGYGNGNQAFKPLAGSLDVAGHEMTHGVIENTAKLEYRNQSGALNESFADIFGVLIDRDDWTLGEDVVKPGAFPSGALRSLQDPNQGGNSLRDRGFQPKNMSQYAFLKDTPAEDNGGVHINSGIPNHAFYLFASNNAVGLARAEKVYYQVITNYLTRTSKFLDLRLAVIDASKNLYGDAVANAARQAFDQVGIVESTTSQPQPDKTPQIPVNPGAESLVIYDPVEQTLYAGVFGQNNYLPIAVNFGCLAKPSVTADG